MKLITTQPTLGAAAAKSGMSEPTARKYRQTRQLPSQSPKERVYRTRPDPFSEVWTEVEELLKRDTSIEAKTIFDYLCRSYEGVFAETQLRTLQRHVKLWRARNGEAREVMFAQVHTPGRQAQSDFTFMNELNIQIAGGRFDHLLYHFCLSYSNWEAATVCFSESFESLSAGVQNALWELGTVPQEHRTDSLSAAVNNLSEADEFTARYAGLLAHYSLTASHNTPGRGHENGDIEQAHHRFKRAVHQELILRGSRDFGDRAEYDAFLRRLLKRRNATRRTRLAEELAVMRALPARRLEDDTRVSVRVSRNSTVLVRGNFYSVPSQLIGERVEVRIHVEHLEVWYGGRSVQQMPRLRGSGRHRINYRHVIESLVRKPGAFANYRYQADLFPGVIFRVAYDLLHEAHPATADRHYVRLLELAATEGEAAVAEALRELVTRGEPITLERVAGMVASSGASVINTTAYGVQVAPVVLTSYDSLLRSGQEVRS
ncbi:MAG: IS21 family transposase [Acidobacteriota bacterium]|nr:IS21 family transposase [Acidobacteriota bacterium]